MTNRKSLWTAPAFSLLLLGSVTAAPALEQAAIDNLTNEERVEVRAAEETRIAKAENPDYDRQLMNLADQYRKTAQLVEQQGGDPTPLLEAAAYFEQKAVQ